MVNPLLIEIPSSIETDRLLLRSARAGDGRELHGALVESLVELRTFLGSLPWVAEEQTYASAEIRSRQCQANFFARTDLPYFGYEKSSGRLIGSVGLHRTDWYVPKTEIGYWIRTSAIGNGYASEAVTALVELALGQLEVERIELVTDEKNLASRKVAEHCHFELEGIHRNVRRDPDGHLRSNCVYAKLRKTTAVV